MSTRRLSIVLLTLAAANWTADNQADACWLTDCLFGRSAPVVVGYPPAYASGYAPYAAGYAPVASPYPVAAPYVAGYTAPQSPLATNGAYQVQRPAYYDNPSVYTGQPLLTAAGNAQTTYRLPVTSQVPLSTSLRGTASPDYQSAYPTTAAQWSVPTSVGAPAAAIPATPVAPLYPVAQPRRGGLSRFFGSLLGTNYRTSYYRAPVTYYRPAISVDPMTGTAVTVQQPCTSYAQQIQRTPLRSVLPASQSPSTAYPSSTYPASPYPVSPYPASAYPSTGFPGNGSGIGQVGAITSPSDQDVIPIPSIGSVPSSGSSLPPSHYQQPSYQPQPSYSPNLAPLTGAPSASGGDLAPIEQSRLESARPAESATPQPENTPPTRNSYWKLQQPEDSTAMSPPRHATDPASLSPPSNHDLRPIPAPEDYDSPFRRREVDASSIVPVTQQPLVAPPLPPSTWDATDATSASTRNGTLYREAALIRKSPSPRPAKPVTETGWYTVIP